MFHCHRGPLPGLAVFCVAAIVFVSACSSKDNEEIVHVVSMVSLIANPSQYHGQWVSVQGVVELSSGGEPAVFLSFAHAAHGDVSSGICLSKLGVADELWQLADGEWAGIRGVFDADDRCHAGLYAGTIREIDRLEALPPNSEVAVQLRVQQPGEPQ